MKIGFLGLGAMGTPMALRLIAAGHELAVWNRTEGRTKPLLSEGAIAAATPAEAELGADAPRLALHLHVVAEIFLRLVRMIVAPLIFASLTTGIAGHQRLRSLGRIAWKTFVYFEVVTTLALLVGAAATGATKLTEPSVLSAQPAGSAPPTSAQLPRAARKSFAAFAVAPPGK